MNVTDFLNMVKKAIEANNPDLIKTDDQEISIETRATALQLLYSANFQEGSDQQVAIKTFVDKVLENTPQNEFPFVLEKALEIAVRNTDEKVVNGLMAYEPDPEADKTFIFIDPLTKVKRFNMTEPLIAAFQTRANAHGTQVDQLNRMIEKLKEPVLAGTFRHDGRIAFGRLFDEAVKIGCEEEVIDLAKSMQPRRRLLAFLAVVESAARNRQMDRVEQLISNDWIQSNNVLNGKTLSTDNRLAILKAVIKGAAQVGDTTTVSKFLNVLRSVAPQEKSDQEVKDALTEYALPAAAAAGHAETVQTLLDSHPGPLDVTKALAVGVDPNYEKYRLPLKFYTVMPLMQADFGDAYVHMNGQGHYKPWINGNEAITTMLLNRWDAEATAIASDKKSFVPEPAIVSLIKRNKKWVEDNLSTLLENNSVVPSLATLVRSMSDDEFKIFTSEKLQKTIVELQDEKLSLLMKLNAMSGDYLRAANIYVDTMLRDRLQLPELTEEEKKQILSDHGASRSLINPGEKVSSYYIEEYKTIQKKWNNLFTFGQEFEMELPGLVDAFLYSIWNGTKLKWANDELPTIQEVLQSTIFDDSQDSSLISPTPRFTSALELVSGVVRNDANLEQVLEALIKLNAMQAEYNNTMGIHTHMGTPQVTVDNLFQNDPSQVDDNLRAWDQPLTITTEQNPKKQTAIQQIFMQQFARNVIEAERNGFFNVASSRYSSPNTTQEDVEEKIRSMKDYTGFNIFARDSHLNVYFAYLFHRTIEDRCMMPANENNGALNPNTAMNAIMFCLHMLEKTIESTQQIAINHEPAQIGNIDLQASPGIDEITRKFEQNTFLNEMIAALNDNNLHPSRRVAYMDRVIADAKLGRINEETIAKIEKIKPLLPSDDPLGDHFIHSLRNPTEWKPENHRNKRLKRRNSDRYLSNVAQDFWPESAKQAIESRFGQFITPSLDIPKEPVKVIPFLQAEGLTFFERDNGRTPPEVFVMRTDQLTKATTMTKGVVDSLSRLISHNQAHPNNPEQSKSVTLMDRTQPIPFNKGMLFITDDLDTFDLTKDTTFALMHAAKEKGYPIWVTSQKDLVIDIDPTNRSSISATARLVELKGNNTMEGWLNPNNTDLYDIVEKDGKRKSIPKEPWYEVVGENTIPVTAFDAVLNRKDPPFNEAFLTMVRTLNNAEKSGALVVNNCQDLLEHDEKLRLVDFPEHTVPTIVTGNLNAIRRFAQSQFDQGHEQVVMKPLGDMGGSGIQIKGPHDPEFESALAEITDNGQRTIMAQRKIPGIHEHGDRRVFIINREVQPVVMARFPQKDKLIANLAQGGTAQIREISEAERKIAEDVAKRLPEGSFVGIDILGDPNSKCHLTEINNTCPTGGQHVKRGMLEQGVPAEEVVDIAAIYINEVHKMVQARKQEMVQAPEQQPVVPIRPASSVLTAQDRNDLDRDIGPGKWTIVSASGRSINPTSVLVRLDGANLKYAIFCQKIGGDRLAITKVPADNIPGNIKAALQGNKKAVDKFVSIKLSQAFKPITGHQKTPSAASLGKLPEGSTSRQSGSGGGRRF